MTYSFHPEAERDLRDAAEFYQQRAGRSLSQSFLAEFEKAVNNLVRYPELGMPWRGNNRRYVMGRFPYSLVYRSSAEDIRILAVAHHSRQPNYWHERG